jgi:predicted ATP-grasp superfamily ATP-dependent carboligase
MKPYRGTMAWNDRVGQKAVRVFDATHLLETWVLAAPDYPVLVQEWVEGGDDHLYSFNGYFDASGQPLATFIARKVRQWPPHTGMSSLGVECRNDVVLETALRLFASVPYRGFAYFEMKRDARTGQHYAIEANIGRPTGRSPIAEAGGVELHYTAYCDALGLPCRRPECSGTGVPSGSTSPGTPRRLVLPSQRPDHAAQWLRSLEASRRTPSSRRDPLRSSSTRGAVSPV